MTLLIITIVVVIVLSALFSGAEAALLSFPRSRILGLKRSNTRRDRRLVKIYDDLPQAITTIVVLNNLSNIAGSLFVGSLAASVLNSTGIGILSALLTFSLIVFSEVIPKTFGEYHAQTLVPRVSLATRWATILLFPISWVLTSIAKLFTRGAKPSLNTSEREIRLLALKGRREGVIEEDEALMVQRIFRLNDITARDLMTPDERILFLPAETPLASIAEPLPQMVHSRILVTGDSFHDVIGIALKDDLLEGLVPTSPHETVRDVVRPALFVESTVKADDLIRLFQEHRTHLAVVRSADDKTIGVVTLEDVIEEVFGDIKDETDRPHEH